VRALVQRVSRASVRVEGAVVGEIDRGLVVLVGVHGDDDETDAAYVAEKVANLRIFPDDEGKMNRSVLDEGASVLVVSQFTLYADTRKGRRPSFVEAARPEQADPLVDRVCERLADLGVKPQSGVFGAHMEVELTNDGPVTILIDTQTSKGE
jgi:D-tyrosyl-tRNA(Tyr) deacylase